VGGHVTKFKYSRERIRAMLVKGVLPPIVRILSRYHLSMPLVAGTAGNFAPSN